MICLALSELLEAINVIFLGWLVELPENDLFETDELTMCKILATNFLLHRSKPLQIAQFNETIPCVVSKAGTHKVSNEALSWFVAEGHTAGTSRRPLLI